MTAKRWYEPRRCPKCRTRSNGRNFDRWMISTRRHAMECHTCGHKILALNGRHPYRMHYGWIHCRRCRFFNWRLRWINARGEAL